MHRSRVFAVIIDVPREAQDEAAAFWSGALGQPARRNPAEPQFTGLGEAIPGIVTALQSVDDTGRYHVDIETDDVDAEVRRLLELGATEVSQWLECHVLRAPGGHLLCVIPVHSDREVFDAGARVWP
ncbi:VOC family protein [Micromonospora sp. KC723]|uniref:VOC family protein n=1 Tax=Micromonospora sp. KC723 TaxID=2530381 RepID=UPI001050F6C0|nr:VOC family protein [Micromonospora sp. KC723]TDB78258.1 VOC family protein [Micromonospora sp. KC723]